jgi:hypothetical protein
MAINIQPTSTGGSLGIISVEPPDSCPLCHHSIEPIVFVSYFGKLLEVAFRCPRVACQRVFISRYTRVGDFWSYQQSAPLEHRPRTFDEPITNLSTDFVQIYNQAHQAEEVGLDQICGPGYRKALEFLIKDYAKRKHPNDAPTIEKKLLGDCIREYVDHPTAKEIAKRATWLGNDETHYLRRWENKDVTDLKKLIELTVHWIELDLISAEVIQDMPDPKSGGTGA